MNKNGIWMYLGIFLTLQQGFQLSKSWPRHRFGSKGLAGFRCWKPILTGGTSKWDELSNHWQPSTKKLILGKLER